MTLLSASPPASARRVSAGGRLATGSVRRRPPTNAEVLSPHGADRDPALQRVSRTPPVFQASGEGGLHSRRRELRANLLPSILHAPLEGPGGESASACDDTPAPAEAAETEDYFYKLYRDQVESREQAENAERAYMERDASFPPREWDPLQLAAASCSTFQGLVSERMAKFRRSQELSVDTGSELPFSYAEQRADLQALSGILTLDLERRELPFKVTGKRPGFMSLQIASRVPLAVRDPTALGAARVHSQKLGGSGMQVLRLDMHPGEVRQIAYCLDGQDFRQSALAGHMEALVDPERGALAGTVRLLRAKEAQARALVSVLNDLLRDMPTALPPGPEPALGEVGGEAPAARLRALTALPAQTLARLLAAVEALAELAAPLVPSLAHALDRVSLVCVREVDRLAARFHEDYERLLRLWARAEASRRELIGVIDRMGGEADGSGGIELKNRVAILQRELSQQEHTHSGLIAERGEQEARLEEEARRAAALQRRVRELQDALAALQREHQARGAPAARGGAAAARRAPVPAPAAAPDAPQEAAEEGEAASGAGPEARAAPAGRGAPHACFSAATQTDTEHFFSDGARHADELSHREYGQILKTADRLFGLLRSYEWNNSTSSYLLRGEEEDSGSDDAPNLPPVPQKVRPPHAGAVGAQSAKLQLLANLRARVERAHLKASMVQQEEELSRLQACAREGFEPWVARTLGELGGDVRGGPPTPEALWEALLASVNAQGLQRRVQELEEHLGSLLPLVERVRADRGDGEASSDGAFWRRVMRTVRQSAVAQKGGPQAAERPARRRSFLFDGGGGPQGLPQLLGEVDAILASLSKGGADEHLSVTLARVSSPHVVQGGVKAFYLRKTGRSKFVEAATIALCRAVVEHAGSPRVALFAVMCDIIPPTSLGDRLPAPLRSLAQDCPFKLQAAKLGDMPSDAAFAVSALMRELRSRPRTPQPGAAAGLEDPFLPLQLVLDAGQTAIAHRSRATAGFLELALYSLADFPPLHHYHHPHAPEAGGARPAAEEDARRRSLDPEQAPESPAPTESEGSDQPWAGVEESQMQEMLFVSHLLAAHVRHALRRAPAAGAAAQDDLEHRYLDELWNRLMLTSSSLGGLRRSLGLLDGTCSALRVGELLAENGVVHVPPPMVARALLAAKLGGVAGEVLPEAEPVDARTFKQLALMCRRLGGEEATGCRESLALWAGLWALVHERAHELALMGQLFEVFDASKDGWLQYEEFAEFLSTIAPHISQLETEELFMSGAEEVTGDMTKEVFLSLVMRLGITTDVDLLEGVVGAKR